MIQRFMKMMNKNKKGFTLVELMVVVVIIGVLVAIAVPVYNNVTSTANQRAIQANLRIIDGAIGTYTADKEISDKTSIDVAASANPSDATATEIKKYLQAWPKGPGTTVYGITDGKAVTG